MGKLPDTCGRVTNWRDMGTSGKNINIHIRIYSGQPLWEMEIKPVNLWKATASRGFDLQAMGSSMFTPSTVAGLALEPSYVSSKMCCQRFYIVVCSSQISLYHETISWKLISLSRMLCVLIASPVSVDRQSSPWPCTSLSFFALQYPLRCFLKWGIPKTGFSTKMF